MELVGLILSSSRGTLQVFADLIGLVIIYLVELIFVCRSHNSCAVPFFSSK